MIHFFGKEFLILDGKSGKSTLKNYSKSRGYGVCSILAYIWCTPITWYQGKVHLNRNHCLNFEIQRAIGVHSVVCFWIHINQFISVCFSLFSFIAKLRGSSSTTSVPTFHTTYHKFVTMHVEHLFISSINVYSRQWFVNWLHVKHFKRARVSFVDRILIRRYVFVLYLFSLFSKTVQTTFT